MKLEKSEGKLEPVEILPEMPFELVYEQFDVDWQPSCSRELGPAELVAPTHFPCDDRGIGKRGVIDRTVLEALCKGITNCDKPVLGSGFGLNRGRQGNSHCGIRIRRLWFGLDNYIFRRSRCNHIIRKGSRHQTAPLEEALCQIRALTSDERQG